MTSMRRFAAAALLLSSLLPGPTLAAGSEAAPTLDVDALLRNHTPADEPRAMDVRIEWEDAGADALATVDALREAEGEYEGQPARVWTSSLRISTPTAPVPDIVAEVREYVGLDGRRLGGTAAYANQTSVETIIVRNHPLPTAARVGEEGPISEGSETTRRAGGEITAQFFEEHWRVVPAVGGEPRLQVIRDEVDGSGNVTNRFTSDYAVTPEGKLRLVSSHGRDLVGPRKEMRFTPR